MEFLKRINYLFVIDIAVRKFEPTNPTTNYYFRYSCSKHEHDERVRRLMGNDGIYAWDETISSEPFKIEKTPPHDLGGKGCE